MKLLLSNGTKFFASIMCDKTIGAPCESQAVSFDRRLYVKRHVLINISNTSGLQSSLIDNCFRRYDAMHNMFNTNFTRFFFSAMSDDFGSFPFSSNFKETKPNIIMRNLNKTFKTALLTLFYFIGIVMFTLIRIIPFFKFTL